MLISYLLAEKYQFRFRWLFGAGVAFSFIGIGVVTTSFCQERSSFTFADNETVYYGIVTDTPQEKPATTAYRVFLPDEDKQVVCYFARDSFSKDRLAPGDRFLFRARIQPFRNMGNPDDFDYVKYMYNQGFAGSAYVPSRSWKKTDESTSSSLVYTALHCRQQLLDFYKSLGFSQTEYSILSALTLGYKNDLTDEIQQGFRTTGTVHVLSVSGLHVGIIYLMISFLLGFIRRNSRYYWIKPALIIILLWVYAFVTGLPISVIRASIMLSIYCFGEMVGRKILPLHALYIAAFFILLVNPFAFFDIGFQLSFSSVFAILYLLPKVVPLVKTSNVLLQRIWQMLALSVVAQLATFPLCLYYFGTFPTYFFIGNLFIVPLVSLIMYAIGGVFLAKIISAVFSGVTDFIFFVPVQILKFLVYLMTFIISFIEKLPFALVEDVKISFIELVLIYLVICGVVLFFQYKKPKAMILGLASVFALLLINIHNNLVNEPDNLTVYNRRNTTEIIIREGGTERQLMKNNIEISYVPVTCGEKTALILSGDTAFKRVSEDKKDIDILILTRDNTLSLYSLTQIFSPRQIIVDGSLSTSTRRRLARESEKLNIPCHDVVENGAFSLIF